MNITEQRAASVAVVSIDGGTAPDLQGRIPDIVERGDVEVLLDCGKIEYISSASLHAVRAGARHCKRSGGKLCKRDGGKLSICALQPGCKLVLEINGFHTIIDMHETRETALEAAAPRSASC